jgi:hypothetical protein
VNKPREPRDGHQPSLDAAAGGEAAAMPVRVVAALASADRRPFLVRDTRIGVWARTMLLSGSEADPYQCPLKPTKGAAPTGDISARQAKPDYRRQGPHAP